MRKKLKKRFINKIKRKGIDVGTCLLYAKMSDSLEEAREMQRLQQPRNLHKLRFEGPRTWFHWEMYDIIVKRSGRRLGATSAKPTTK